MQVYRRPKGRWNQLARKYSKWMLQVYIGSPIIELDGHQYMEVEYFGSFDGEGPYPNVNVRGIIVLCDGQSVVNDISIAKHITHLGLLLLSDSASPIIRQMQSFVADWEQRPLAKNELLDQADWYIEHQNVLCQYVSKHSLASFLSAFENKLEALHRCSMEAASMLQTLDAILRHSPVPAEHIEALAQFFMRAHRWNTQNTRALVEGYGYAEQLYKELSKRRNVWEQNKAVSAICEQALQAWQTMAEAGQETRAELEKTEYAALNFEREQRLNWQKFIDKRMEVYKVPLFGRDTSINPYEEQALTDAELEHIVAGLPSLPEHPLWQSDQTEHIVIYVVVGLGIVAALGGIVLSGVRILGGSFSAVLQLLFFISWLFMLPRYLKRPQLVLGAKLGTSLKPSSRGHS